MSISSFIQLDISILFCFIKALNALDVILSELNSVYGQSLSFCSIKNFLKCHVYSHVTGELIANVILRHRQAACQLPRGWQEEKLKDQTIRALSALHTFVFERNEYLLMAYTWKEPFSAPAFAFMFPLLRLISKDRGSLVGENEALRMKVFQLVMAHSKLRAQFDQETSDEV